MKTIKKITVIALVAVLFGCSQNKNEHDVSDVLENTIAGVVTVKVENNGIGKTAFGYAEDTPQERSNSDIAYAEMLKLGNAKGVGSGFVIENNGKKYVVTNAHVIEAAKDLNNDVAAFNIGRKEYRMKFKGADSFYDIAVLEFEEEPDSTINTISFSERNPRIGQKVFAIGNPLGYYPYTVTEGIISAINRPGITAKSGYLQSSAMISSGNSGGPLIDEHGHLVGVNTLGSSKAQQLNFALEVSIVEKVVDDIISNGRVLRAYFGLEVAELFNYTQDDNGNLTVNSLFEKPTVVGTIPFSPASKALQGESGYDILMANHKEIYSNQDLLGVLESLGPKDTLKLKLEKDGILKELEIIGTELNDARLADIANFYFEKHYGISLTNHEDGVILNYPKGRQYNTFQVYDERRERFRSYIPRGERTFILACGNTEGMQGLDIWRTEEVKDLGNALRLSAMNGQISFLEYDGKTPFFIRVLISDREDIIAKTILN